MKTVIKKLGSILLIVCILSAIFISPNNTVHAASYPLIIVDSSQSTKTIMKGETGQICFTIYPEYHNEKYHVLVYNSSGSQVASAESSYYNSDGTFTRTVTITIDTAKLDLPVGTYEAVYWLSFYSLQSWHDAPNKYSYTFEVTPYVCSGTHVYDSKCDADCNACGQTRSVTHTYSGNCDPICNVCGAGRDSGGSHTYSNKTDTECDICGYTRVVIEEDTSSVVDSGSCGSNVNWKLTKNGTLVISGSGNMYGYTYDTIPWYDYRRSIKKVQVLPGVTSIGNYAFYYHQKLECVEIADTVNLLGKSCFSNCFLLREAIIPYGVKSIPEYAFDSCENLVNISLPSTIKSFGDRCFEDCSSLAYFIIPDGVTNIAYGMFWGAANLEYVQIPASVTKIETFAFHECGNLSDVYYTGTKEQFGEIDISSLNTYNEGLLYATMHYSSKAPCVRCTFGGWIEGDTYRHKRVCTNCGKSETANHSFNSGTVTTQPNCYQTGTKAYTCTACGFIKTESVPTTGIHNYSNWSNIDEQSHSRSCQVCGQTQNSAHTWNAGVVTTAPNCKDTGIKTYTCTGCATTKTEVVAKTNTHTYGAWVMFDTLSHSRTCTYCQKTETVLHNLDDGKVTTKPTCIATGIRTYTCVDCFYNETAVEPKADVHTYGSWIKVDDQRHKHICTACQKEETANHVWSDKVVHKPTSIQQGYVEYICACGATTLGDFVPASGLAAPVVKISKSAEGKQKLSWNEVVGATGYDLYRSTKKTSGFTKVATIAETTWTDTDSAGGTTYYYKVEAVYREDTSLNSGYSNIASMAGQCNAPEISVDNDNSGKPKISWNKISGAKKYTIYRATSETGKYTKLGTATKTTYTDSKAKAGTTYFYKVIANASKSTYNSGYSNIVSCGVICGTPSVTVKIDTNTGKPSLSWGKVDGAAKYAIYRDGELLTTVTGTTYADTSAAIDTRYTYTVQALGKTEALNGNPSKEVVATAGIAKPAVKGSVDAVSGKPVLTWNAVEGAVKYEIYRSTKSNKSYKLLDTVETLSFEDISVSAGKTYYYQVKAVGEVSKSANSSYVKLTGKCGTPTITVSASESSGKPVLSWEKISGAKKYTVYRATSETGKYTKLGTTTKLTYTDSKASAGTVYFYKIVANASSSKYNSGYSNIVSCGVNCAAPAVKVSLNASGKPVLSWSKVTGAVKYEVYKNGALLTTVTTTGYTDSAAQAGETCTYTVVAVCKNAAYNSAPSADATVTATCATPKASGKVGANKKPVITWGEVEGATKYVIYRSTSKSKGYKAIDETEALTYEDLTAKKGKTYYYKVVAVGDGCESAQSGNVKVKSK